MVVATTRETTSCYSAPQDQQHLILLTALLKDALSSSPLLVLCFSSFTSHQSGLSSFLLLWQLISYISVEIDSVECILLNAFIYFVSVHKFFHTFLANSLGVKYLEEFLELFYVKLDNRINMDTFLNMVSWLDQDHLFSSGLFSEANKIEECGLSELVNGDISEPHVESVVLLVVETGEAPVRL